MQKKILTQEDFDNNPELSNEGLKIGDEIEIPEGDEQKEISLYEKKASPLKEIVKNISELSQADRLVLYGRLDKLAYHDRDRFSGGLDSDPAIFEQAINSL
jgi:hypothetical protein